MFILIQQQLYNLIADWVVDETKFNVKNMISLSLSCDHRVMDGVMGANFINTVKK